MSSDLFTAIAPWLIALIVIVAVGAVLLYAVRRFVSSSGGDQPGDFSLQELRELHAQGKLSDEEFAKARDAVIGRLRAADAAPKDDRNERGVR